MNNLVKYIPFDGRQFPVKNLNGVPHVAMHPLVEALGLDWATQLRSIKRDPVLSSTVGEMTTVAEDGKIRMMTSLPLEFIQGWLFKIDAGRYQGARKDAIVRYQRECYHVLNAYWTQGAAVNPRVSNEQLAALIEENTRYHKLDSVFGCRTLPGTPSKVNGRPRMLPRRATLCAPRSRYAVIDMDVLQMLLPFAELPGTRP